MAEFLGFHINAIMKVTLPKFFMVWTAAIFSVVFLLNILSPMVSGQECRYIPRGKSPYKMDVFCEVDCWTLDHPHMPKGRQKSIVLGLQVWLLGKNCSLIRDQFCGYDNLEWILIHGGKLSQIGSDLFECTPRLKKVKLLSEPTSSQILGVPLQYEAKAVEDFEANLACTNISWMDQLTFLRTTAKRITLACSNSPVELGSYAFLNYLKLKSLELQLRGTFSLATEAISSNWELRDLSISLSQRNPSQMIYLQENFLYDLPKLQTINIRGIVNLVIKNGTLCSELSRDIRAVNLLQVDYQFLQRCHDLWICESCGLYPFRDPQTLELLLSGDNLTLDSLLPSVISRPFFNTTSLRIYHTDIREIDRSLTRFPHLEEYFHQRILYTVRTYFQYEGGWRRGDIVTYTRNVFLDLPNPSRLREVRLSFSQCNCAVLNTQKWFTEKLPRVQLRIFCFNFVCYDNITSTDMWTPAASIITHLSPYCNGTIGKDASAIPKTRLGCKISNIRGGAGASGRGVASYIGLPKSCLTLVKFSVLVLFLNKSVL